MVVLIYSHSNDVAKHAEYEGEALCLALILAQVQKSTYHFHLTTTYFPLKSLHRFVATNSIHALIFAKKLKFNTICL